MKKLLTIILICMLSVLSLFGCSASVGSSSNKKAHKKYITLCNNNAPLCSGAIYFKANTLPSDTEPTLTDRLNEIDGDVDEIFVLVIRTYSEASYHYHIIVSYYEN